jgi:hypothetical protein
MAEDQTAPGVGEGPAKVISISLPEGTLRALRETAGGRGVSALVTVAVEEHLRNRATLEYLSEYEHEHGPFTAEERKAAADVWADAEQRESRWPEAG